MPNVYISLYKASHYLLRCTPINKAVRLSVVRIHVRTDLCPSAAVLFYRPEHRHGDEMRVD